MLSGEQAVFKFLLPVCYFSLKMIWNYIEILQVHQRLFAFVSCITFILNQFVLFNI